MKNNKEKKPSEIFEGESSSLRRTYEDAVNIGAVDMAEAGFVGKRCGRCGKEHDLKIYCEIISKAQPVVWSFESFDSFFAGLPPNDDRNAIILYEKYLRDFIIKVESAAYKQGMERATSLEKSLFDLGKEEGKKEACEEIEKIKSKNIKVEKVDTYKCQSIVEGGEVKNCTCGKCF